MSSNGEAEAAINGSGGPVENGDSVTMVDVLEEEERLEEDVEAVLGPGDDQRCTYPKGYMPRQPLYSCETCGTADPAAICLACSLHCHADHSMIELYTKRRVRCDCGNNKFGARLCKLEPKKDATNEKNVYNQNYKGLYCTCHRPYPDLEGEDDNPDEMIQCVVCEDWFHSKHLKCNSVPSNYEEMICQLCTHKHPWLFRYAMSTTATTEAKEGDSVATGGESEPRAEATAGACVMPRRDGPQREQRGDDWASVGNPLVPEGEESVPRGVAVEGGPPEAAALWEEDDGALFFEADWRKKLCSCPTCQDLYRAQQLTFLLDPCDSVSTYEAKGRGQGAGEGSGGSGTAKGASSYTMGMEALMKMDRVTQIEAMSEYNSMKDELKEYLRQFAEHGKVVTPQDIEEFFKQLRSKKRPRLELPTNCR